MTANGGGEEYQHIRSGKGGSASGGDINMTGETGGKRRTPERLYTRHMAEEAILAGRQQMAERSGAGTADKVFPSNPAI